MPVQFCDFIVMLYNNKSDYFLKIEDYLKNIFKRRT